MHWIDTKHRTPVGDPILVASRRLGATRDTGPSFRSPPPDLPTGGRECGTLRRNGEILARLFSHPDNSELVGVDADDTFTLEAIQIAEVRQAAWAHNAIVGTALHADGSRHIAILRRGMAEVIRVRLAKGKPAVIEVDGCAGPTCKTLTEGLVSKLGKVVDEAETDEFYQQEITEQQRQTN